MNTENFTLTVYYSLNDDDNNLVINIYNLLQAEVKLVQI